MWKLSISQPLFLSLQLYLCSTTLAATGPYANGFPAPPISGNASSTQFPIASEFVQGTSCGLQGLNGNQPAPNGPGTGPGLLYAAINELGFGSHKNAGPACGTCYKLTPSDAHNVAVPSRAMTFMIVDLCPPVSGGINQPSCGQCALDEVNPHGQHYNFDIASDAMSSAQYVTFFGGPPSDDHLTNMNNLQFEQTACDATTNPVPTVATPPQSSNNPGGSCFSGQCFAGDPGALCASEPHLDATPTPHPRMLSRRYSV